jgi:glycosyltransferase involved in cell wall biosynthesis
MSRPTISIITACLNADDHLRTCISSVQEQSFQSLEHIVIDGGSADSTTSILKGVDSSKLKWISEPDSGIAEAMNKGIRMANGEWILFLHADDQLISADSLKVAAERLPDSPGILSFRVELKSENGTSTLIDNPGWCFKTNFRTSLGHQGALIHRDLFNKIGTYDESFKIAMDYDWFMRAFHQGIPIHCHVETLSIMRDTGISSRTDWDSLAYRFSEEKRAHTKNTHGIFWKKIYQAYWALYPTYRKIKYAMSRSRAK